MKWNWTCLSTQVGIKAQVIVFQRISLKKSCHLTDFCQGERPN